MIDAASRVLSEYGTYIGLAIILIVAVVIVRHQVIRERRIIRDTLDREKFKRAVDAAVADEREKIRIESKRLSHRSKELSEAEAVAKSVRMELAREKDLLDLQLDEQRRNLDARKSELERQYLSRLQALEEQYQKQIVDAQRKIDFDSARLIQLRRDMQSDIERANDIERFVERYRASITEIASAPLQSIPAVAQMTSDCIYIYDTMIANALELKRKPAVSGAQKIQEYGELRRELIRSHLIYQNRNRLLESYFPWVSDLYDLPIQDVPNKLSSWAGRPTLDDPAYAYLSPNEIVTLQDEEKYQLALDRYVKSDKKTPWQLVRDYELYIAHLFRSDGYTTLVYGSLLTIDNLHRHIRACSGNRVAIISCKYWPSGKVVHEKHIYQLFGVCMDYQISHPSQEVACVLATNTRCTARAHAFAERMSMLIREGIEIGYFDRVKCVTYANGIKRFFLPMDPQYDSVNGIDLNTIYVATVSEAISCGYRRQPYKSV